MSTNGKEASVISEIMTERQLQDNIIDAARKLGWLVAFFRPARVLRNGKEIYETPVGADGAGWPDLVLVRERVIWVECKSKKGKLTDDQKKWRDNLFRAGQEYYLFSPRDWLDDSILRILE